MCYFTAIPLILKPSLITCYMARILPGLNLSIIYGALLTKTNRIARILSQSKKRFFIKKLRFMGITSQVIITLTIVSIECFLITAGLFYEPRVLFVNYSKRSEARLECSIEKISVIGPLGYNMFLVVVCTLYAIQTRNLPENFNEAKFIGFSMYTTCVIWIAFFPLFFGSDFKVVTLSLSISFSATVIVAFLFIPKVYIIIFEPEKNQRSAFTTSKNLRCHIGSNIQSTNFLDYDIPLSQRKKSNGLLLLSGLTGPKTSNQMIESKPKYSINYTRYAFRPKISKFYNGFGGKKSIDSMDNALSIYQISDRSCQTSLEYLPIFRDSIKQRKITQSNKRNSLNENDKIEKDGECKNVGALGTLGKFLFYPLVAGNQNLEQLDYKKDYVSDKDDEWNENYLQKAFKSLKNSSLGEKHSSIQNFYINKNIKKKKDLQLIGNTENFNLSHESIPKKSETFNEVELDNYSIKMCHEDESLEDLRKIFSKNQNLVLQWDYVQSSEYI